VSDFTIASSSHADESSAELSDVQSALAAELEKTQGLDGLLQALQAEAHETARKLAESAARESALADKTREHEHDLHAVRSEVQTLRAEAGRHRTRVRELEEQIQNDDRADRLEETLKHTRDKADGLEFKLGKLQQTHAAVKKERDELEEKQRALAAAEGEWQAKHDALHAKHTTLEAEHQHTSAERGAFAEENTALQSHLDEAERALSEIQQRLSGTASEIGGYKAQLQAAQMELRQALRRAEESETLQKELQGESARLVKSLEEERPRIAELSNHKAELMERLDGLQLTLRARDGVIAELEGKIDELQDGHEMSTQERKEEVARREKERATALHDLHALQKAYEDMQKEHESARTTLVSLQQERAADLQAITRHQEELARIKASLRHRDEQLQGARLELEERRRAEPEQRDFLAQAQADVENLRADLAAREEELQQLQHHLDSLSTNGSLGSLNEEMRADYEQQHELEQSTAQSRIRALESAAFEHEANAHALQKRIAAQEDELARLRATSPVRSRPSSRNADLRRQTLGNRRVSGLGAAASPPPQPRRSLDYSMSPEMKAKRQEALRHLQARMEREKTSASARSPSSPSFADGSVPPIRPHFLDEMHIFWCHSCRDDLVIL
jgi:chromosome segregation ATPase